MELALKVSCYYWHQRYRPRPTKTYRNDSNTAQWEWPEWVWLWACTGKGESIIWDSYPAYTINYRSIFHHYHSSHSLPQSSPPYLGVCYEPPCKQCEQMSRSIRTERKLGKTRENKWHIASGCRIWSGFTELGRVGVAASDTRGLVFVSQIRVRLLWQTISWLSSVPTKNDGSLLK